MIDLYYRTTPNAHKITMFLEEAALPYRIIPVNNGKGEQLAPASSNNRLPAIVDHKPEYGSLPLSLFESGSILLYLADKIRNFIPQDMHARMETLQWVFWQMSGLEPMAGQGHHFSQHAEEPEENSRAIERKQKETSRLYAVLDNHLADRDFIANEYSIADIASYPQIVSYERLGPSLVDYPNLNRWFQAISVRPATQRAYAKAQEINQDRPLDEEAREYSVQHGCG